MSELHESSASAPSASAFSPSERAGDSSAVPAHIDTKEERDPDNNGGKAEETETKTKPSDETEHEVEPSKPMQSEHDGQSSTPPLPDEAPPPLPEEAPPTTKPLDDGWEPVWDNNMQAYYFYNRLTGASQWENPRVPETPAAPGTESQTTVPVPKKEPVLGGYNPAIHGDYDPNADYARQYEDQSDQPGTTAAISTAAYAATGAFNRFTGRWQAADINPENHNDENKSRRQMNAYFDVDSAANSHDGRSLRAERSSRKPTKAELKQFKEKRREKKEEKRRAWLRD